MIHLLLAAGAQAVRVVQMPDDPLAHQAIKIAQDTLTVTHRAYAAAIVAAVVALAAFILTYIDVRNNARQFKDFLRRPKFDLKHWHGLQRERGRQDRLVLIVGVQGHNVGERLTEKFMFEVLFPVQYIVPQPTDEDEMRTIKGTKYFFRQFNWGSIMYPNGPVVEIARPAFPFNPDVNQIMLLWRIYDVNGNYPDKDYGKFFVDRTKTPIEET